MLFKYVFKRKKGTNLKYVRQKPWHFVYIKYFRKNDRKVPVLKTSEENAGNPLKA